MKGVSLILFFILVLSMFTFISSSKASANDVRVGVLYYPWYQEGWGNGHWNGSMHWRVVDIPYFGNYSSLDSAIINRQLGAMHDAGIDFILLSWWGNATWCGLNEDTACHYVFDAIKQNFTDMQAFLMVDDIFATPSNVHAKDYSDIYNYINESYLVHYSDYYFKLNGKPVLGWWACSDMTDDIARRRDWVFNSSWTQVFEVRTIGQHHDYNESFDKHWYGWTPSTSTPNETELTFGQSDGFIFIEPRYDDTYKWLWGTTSYGTTKFNQNLTGGYEAQWQAVLDRQTSYGDMKIVCIYSWNSFDERSAIEPCTDYTVPDLNHYYLLNKTKLYIDQLRTVPTLQDQVNSLNDELNYTRDWVYALTVITVILIVATVYLTMRKPKIKQRIAKTQTLKP